MHLLIATTNVGKLREFAQMLYSDGFKFTDLSSFSNVKEVPETGTTFAENAALKAAGYAFIKPRCGLLHSFDSGLCVDALNGSPGIFSARWSLQHGGPKGDAANNGLILEQLQSVPDKHRAAHFACALALSDPQGKNYSCNRRRNSMAKSSGSLAVKMDSVMTRSFLPSITEPLCSGAVARGKIANKPSGRALQKLKPMLTELFSGDARHALNS